MSRRRYAIAQFDLSGGVLRVEGDLLVGLHAGSGMLGLKRPAPLAEVPLGLLLPAFRG